MKAELYDLKEKTALLITAILRGITNIALLMIKQMNKANFLKT